MCNKVLFFEKSQTLQFASLYAILLCGRIFFLIFPKITKREFTDLEDLWLLYPGDKILVDLNNVYILSGR